MGRRLRPEEWAAVVNGLVVFSLPPILFGALTLSAVPYPAIGQSVSPAGSSSWPEAIRVVVGGAAAMVPYALVAAWRTWAHARRWESGDRGWRGIAEAGVCGVAAVLLGLLPATIRHPAQAPPYLIAYGLFGFIGGLPIGLLLFLTARLVLWLTRERATAA